MRVQKPGHARTTLQSSPIHVAPSGPVPNLSHHRYALTSGHLHLHVHLDLPSRIDTTQAYTYTYSSHVDTRGAYGSPHVYVPACRGCCRNQRTWPSVSDHVCTIHECSREGRWCQVSGVSSVRHVVSGTIQSLLTIMHVMPCCCVAT